MSKLRKISLYEIIIYLVMIAIFLMPVVMLLKMSITTADGYGLENFKSLLQESRTQKAIWNTIVIAVLSTLLSTILGTIFAFFIAYTNIKWKRFIEILVLLPYILPSYVVTLAWSSLFQKKGWVNGVLMGLHLPPINIYSIGGIIFVMGMCNIPVVYLITVSMLRKIPIDMEWASRASGYSIANTMRKINLVQALPAIVNGAVLAFLASIDNFSVPAFLGVSSGIPVLSTYIYEKAISFGPTSFRLAAALSVILAVIAVGGTLLQNRLIKKSSGLDSIKEDLTERIQFQPKLRKLMQVILTTFLIFINIVPLIVMIKSSFLKTYGLKLNMSTITFQNYKYIFTNRGVKKALFNSLQLSLLTCIVCLVIGTAIAYHKLRKQSKAAKIIEMAASLTYALPGIVLALAMIFYWSHISNVYGTIKILIIAYITRYIVLQMKGSTTALLSIDPALEEAALVSGSKSGKIWIKIILPLIWKSIISSTFLIFISAMTELTLSSMLASAGTKTIGLSIFNLQQAGDNSKAAAFSTMIILLIGISYLIVNIVHGIARKRG